MSDEVSERFTATPEIASTLCLVLQRVTEAEQRHHRRMRVHLDHPADWLAPWERRIGAEVQPECKALRSDTCGERRNAQVGGVRARVA